VHGSFRGKAHKDAKIQVEHLPHCLKKVPVTMTNREAPKSQVADPVPCRKMKCVPMRAAAGQAPKTTSTPMFLAIVCAP